MVLADAEPHEVIQYCRWV